MNSIPSNGTSFTLVLTIEDIMEQFIFWIMELIVPGFESLKPGEKAVSSFVFIYQVVMIIWPLWIIYKSKTESLFPEEKEKWSLKKLLKFW